MSLSSEKELFKENVEKLRKLYSSNKSLEEKCKKQNKDFNLSKKQAEVFHPMNSKDKSVTELYIAILKKINQFKSDLAKNEYNYVPDDEAVYSQLNKDLENLPEQFAEFIEKIKLYKFENISANYLFIRAFNHLFGFTFSYDSGKS